MGCDDIVLQAQKKNFKPPLKIVTPGDTAEYKDARAICNSRFDLYPCAIAFCLNNDHVSFCIRYCAVNKRPFRVRSGGHQHEGMSSGNDVLIIDLSLMRDPLQFSPPDIISVQPGKQLGNGNTPGTLYYEVAQQKLIMPGGTCESVRIGGLVQGGGWGPSARMYGLTCDSFFEATVILSDGQVVTARTDNTYGDLFWAITGAGGGNFGVVTNLKFRLPSTSLRTLFTITWTKDKMLPITFIWMQMFSGKYEGLPQQCYKQTGSFELVNSIGGSLRLNVSEDNTTAAAILGGIFYGSEPELAVFLAPFLAIPTLNVDIRPARPLLDPHIELARSMQPAPPNAPDQTCDGVPHPHKVTSCFPIDIGNWNVLAGAIIDYLNNSVATADVNKYINLMALGGRVSEIQTNGTAFPYRDKPFMMQMQAWWNDPNPNGAAYVKWINDFRDALVVQNNGIKIPLVEGAFINFPDIDIETGIDINSINGRLKLLNNYYGQNMMALRTVKTKYDPGNLFSFQMSVPGLSAPVLFTGAVINNSSGPKVEELISINNNGALFFNTCVDGNWIKSGPLPVSNTSVPVIMQVTTYPSTGEAETQNIYLLDNAGKLWQYLWNYNGTTSPVNSLSPLFYSSPDKFNYQLSYIAAASIYPHKANALLIVMITASGAIWQMSFMDPWGCFGASPSTVNITTRPMTLSIAANPNGSGLHISIVDDRAGLWYHMIDEQFPYNSWNLDFINVLAETSKFFPGGLPVIAVNLSACAVDAQNTAYICVIDNFQKDLWYLQHQSNGSWNQNFINIQDEIAKSNPNAPRITGFIGLSVSYHFAYNELHVFGSDSESNIYHTTRSTLGVWSVFTAIPR